MVRSRFALLIRGAAAGAIVALSAMLTGCVVDTADPGDALDVAEDVAESTDELEQVGAPGGPADEASGDHQKDPDPVPWRPDMLSNDDPDPDPNAVAHSISTTGPSNNDNH